MCTGFIGMYPVKFYNKENLPEGGCVVVCNHFRAIDCGHMFKLHPKKSFYILAKKELFKNKFLGYIIRKFGGIPVDREKSDMKTILTSVKLLKEGNKLFVFPEGTRNKTGTSELQELKGGSAFFAVKAQCPIVPVMVEKKSRFLRRVKIIVGTPFELSEYYDKKLTSDVVSEMDNIIREKMIEAQKELNEILLTKKAKKHGNSKK